MGYLLNNFKRFILLLGDICLMFGSLWLALIIRHGADYSVGNWYSHWQIFGSLYFIWLLIFFAFNLYDLKANLYVVQLSTNLTKATLVNLIIGIIFFYLISPDIAITPKTILAINVGIITIALFLWRRLFVSLIKTEALENNLIFIGWDPLINEVVKEAPNYGYRAKAIFNLSDKEINDNISLPIYHNLEELPDIIKNKKIHFIILASHLTEQMTNHLFKVLKLRVNFISLTHFYERIFQRIPLSIINQGWFLENLTEGDKTSFEIFKRIFDTILAVICGLISLPFIPLISLIIRLDSKGPILFKQIRTGKDGKPFKAIKFRTMYNNSEEKGPQWAQKKDPRATNIGTFLRKTRIDEIPQLWNILIGEMSFVGPRPERPEFIETLTKEIPFYQERLLVKPGLTGWAQILGPAYGGSKEETLMKLRYDLYYIKNRNIFLDLGIILKTINTVLKGAGQ